MVETATTAKATGAWFDGVLVGAVDDVAALERCVGDLNTACDVRANLHVEGGRFSLLLDDRRRPLSACGESAIESLLERLGAVAEAASPRVELESTLRAVAVGTDEVVERLFAARGRSLRVVARTRARAPEDERRFPTPTHAEPRERRRFTITILLFVVAAAVLGWRAGYIDRLFAPSGSKLAIDLGAFEPLLAADVVSHFGDYEVMVRRGARYPQSARDVDALIAAAATPAERAVAQAVAIGDRIYVRLEDAAREVLASESVELRDLLASADGTAHATIPGRIGARFVRLDLSSGGAPK